LSLAACGRGGADDDPVVALDGSPRVPDDEGVATSLSETSITLDGERTYPVSRRLVSFSTYTGAIEPMLTREGQYVQIGLQEEDGVEAMVWMAGIADVVRVDPPAVYYTGVFVRRDGGAFVFQDGTVLRAGAKSNEPPPETRVTVKIDPSTHDGVVIQAAR
jgi:hypothetical protein